MKFLRTALPNLTISLNIALMIVIYLDRRNPMMGFLVGTPFIVLLGAACAASIATAVVLYADRRRVEKEKHRIKNKKISIDT